MIQQSLFGESQEDSKLKKKELRYSHEQMERIRSRMGRHLMQFWETMKFGDRFHAIDRDRYIRSQGLMAAPESTGRLMRDFRQYGRLNYRVVRGEKSLYEKIPLEPKIPF